MSIIQGVLVLWLLFSHLEIMINNEKTHLEQYETSVDFKKLGEVTLKETMAIPFYALVYKDSELKWEDKTTCKETNGDCFAYVS